jgi:endonuclease/exonuclease/phosphatase (EEP) superfamily protein YafD
VKSAAACVLLAAVSLAGCASVHNYLDLEGPRYAGEASAAPTPRADGSLRVVTFNVAYAKQIPEAIAALRADPLRGADVVTLQEMECAGGRPPSPKRSA